MARKIYAKPGTDYQSVYVDIINPDIPDGFVEMSEDRPGEDFICKNNFDGTGEWVRKSFPWKVKLSKAIETFHYGSYQWVALVLWYPKYLRYRWLSNKQYSIFRVRFLSDLLFGFDGRKNIDFMCLFFPLVIIYSLGLDSGVAYDLLLATSAAAIFDIFVTIIPREQAKREKAEAIHQVLFQLVMLKNFQYEIIGYLPDRLFLPQKEWPVDSGMNRSKANRLMALIKEKGDLSVPERQPQLPITIVEREKINDFFLRANAYFHESLSQLVSLSSADYFTGFHAAAAKAHDLSEQVRFALMVGGAREYVSFHFRFIESLQLHYNVECYRYSRRSFDTQIRFDGESIKEVMNIIMWSYADSAQTQSISTK